MRRLLRGPGLLPNYRKEVGEGIVPWVEVNGAVMSTLILFYSDLLNQ